MRIYSSDQQPVRFLAELLGIAPAEVVHRAVSAFFVTHRADLSRVARDAQAAFEAGDYAALSEALRTSARIRGRRIEERLADLSQPPDAS